MRVFWAYVSVLAVLTFAPVCIAAPSQSIDLGGTWLTIGLDSPAFPPPDAPGWAGVDVIAPVAPRLWIAQRREFDIPAQFAGQHLFLRFEGVKYTAEVRCNGEPVGGHKGGYEPFECDITQVANVGGRNVVEVLCGSWHQLTVDPEKADAEYGLSREGIEMAADEIIYPIGSQNTMGIWAPVSLEARPDVYVEDVFIVPSFRGKTLTVTATIRNLSAQEADCAVGHSVSRDASKLLDLPGASVQVPAGGTAEVTTQADWADPPLWWPDDPVLLQLRSELRTGNAVVDLMAERFGFRELWADGPMFVLNGIPLHMRGNSCHPRGYTREIAGETYRLCREANVNAFRLHAQPWGKAWYDVADETGMLIMHETAVWCYARSYALANPLFWDNFAEHIRAQIKLHRNRPSIFSWSLENELLHVGGSRVPETEQRLADLANVARDVDPGRLINYDGDEDPKGSADIVNLHYPRNFPAFRDWPNTGWWLNEEYRVQGWPRTEWLWDREKPLYIGEYLWEPASVPDPYTLFFGDDAYLDISSYRYAGKGASWRYQVEAHRAEGLSGGCPWNIFEGGKLPDSPMYQATKMAYRPQCIIVREWSSVLSPGQTVTRRLTFINDVLRPAKLVAKWFWLTDGEKTDLGGLSLDMEPAEIRDHTIRLTAPKADARTPADLVFTLEESGKEVFRETRHCSLLPPEPAPDSPGTRIALYDPQGETARLLTQVAGLKTTPAEKLTDIPPDTACLIIGENAFVKPEAGEPAIVGSGGSDQSAVESFVRRGGRAIVLAQEYLPPWIPASLMGDGSTFAFIRRPEHPVVKGCEASDFSLWEPDHYVSHVDLARPERGNAKVIVDAGGAGLNRALLMEQPLGKGAYIFCQLLVAESYARAPLARQTLLRLVDYAAREPLTEFKKLAVYSDDDRLKASLTSLGVQLAEPSTPWAGIAAVLVDGDHPGVTGQRDVLARAVSEGLTVWLHNPSQDYLEQLGLARDAVTWNRTGAAPVRAASSSGLAAGLRNEDLYWLSDTTPKRHADWSLTPEITSHVLRPKLAPANVTDIPADSFDNSQVKITRRATEGIWLSTNGTVTAPVDVPEDGRYVIGVLAGGTPMQEIFPAYTVAVDDKPLGGFMADSREPNLHTVSGELTAGRHELQITFTNDGSSPPNEDRNGLVAGARLSAALPLPDDIVPFTNPTVLYAIMSGKGAWLVDGINWDDPGRNATRAARLVCTLLTNAGVDIQAVSAGTPVSLAEFTLDPGATHVRNDAQGIYLGDTAWTEGKVTFAQDGNYEFIIEAQGTEADGEFPEIEVYIDGELIGAQHLVSVGWQNLSFPAKVQAGERTVRLRFTNDFYDAALHLDRNLWIRRLAVATTE